VTEAWTVVESSWKTKFGEHTDAEECVNIRSRRGNCWEYEQNSGWILDVMSVLKQHEIMLSLLRLPKPQEKHRAVYTKCNYIMKALLASCRGLSPYLVPEWLDSAFSNFLFSTKASAHLSGSAMLEISKVESEVAWVQVGRQSNEVNSVTDPKFTLTSFVDKVEILLFTLRYRTV
jgi:hypothetical protein